jgi:hypothetical protein
MLLPLILTTSPPRLAAGDIYSSQQPHPQQSTAVATTTPYSASPVLLTLLKSNVLIASSLARYSNYLPDFSFSMTWLQF